MKKLLFLMLTILLSISSLKLSAQSLTVANGTETNAYIPFYGYWMDAAQHNQIIYPASMLTDLTGETISGIIFYLNSAPENDWNTSATLSLGTTNNSSFSSSALDASAVTPVYTGSISIVNNQIAFNLDSAFTYTGGNLLLDITTVSGTYSAASFYGISQTNGSFVSYSTGYSDYNVAQDFIPKTLFVYGNCAAPSNLTVTNITQASANLSWTPGGSESMWEVYCGNGTENLDTVSWISATDTFYSFSNLSANTQYVVYVRANCGSEYSYGATSSFHTDCGITPVPYVEGFESAPSYSLPSCWGTLNSYNSWGTIYPCSHGYGGHTGDKMLAFYYDNSGTTGIEMAVLPPFNLPLNELQISLYAMRDDYSPSGTFYIGYLTDPNNANTFVNVYSTTATAMGDNDYHKLIADFSNVQVDPDSSYYIAIGYYSTDSYCYWYVDDIVVEQIPDCSEPTNMVVNNVTTTSAVVSWNPGTATNFNLHYKAIQDTAFTEISYISDTSYLLENLTPSTIYYWYVTSICDDGSLVNGEVVYFPTSCGAIDNLPYFVNFETSAPGGDLPICWTRGPQSYDNPYIYDYDAYSGNKCLYFYDPNHVALPAIDDNEIDFSDILISFYAKAYTIGTTLQVGVMTNPNVPNTFVQVGNAITLSDQYQLYELSLGSYTGTGTYLAFRNTDYNTIYVDNVTVDFLPDCHRPEIVSLETADTASISISWSATADQSDWEVVIGASGFNPDSVAATTVATNSYTFENLTPNTAYDIYVRTICGNDFSAWSNVLSTYTLIAAAATLPYTCDFENPAENALWTLLNGSETNKWYIDTAANNTDNGNFGLYVSNDNGVTNNYDNGTYSTVWAYRDIQFSDANEFVLSFDWRGYGESCCDYIKVYIGNPAPVTVGSTTQPAGSTPIGTYNVANNWTHATTTLGNAYHGATKRLYFMWKNDSSSGSNPAGAIDNISIIGIDCAAPTNVAVSEIDTNSATILITPGSASDVEWEVIYGTSDTSMTSVTVNTTNYTLSGLTPSTNYTVYARTLCTSGDTSAWSPALIFQTECPTIISIPQTWNMESNNFGGTPDYPIPVCWTKGSSSETYPYVVNYEGYGSNSSLFFYNYYRNLVASPVIDTNLIPINSLQVSFYARTEDNSYYDAQLLVGITSDVYDNTAFTVIDTIYLTESYPTNPYVVMFNHYTGPGDRIVFKNSSSSTYAYNYIYLDDVTIEALPNCLPVSALTVTGHDYTSITLNWTEGESESSWNLEYKEYTDSVWTPITVTSTPFTLTNLDIATLYDIRVQADCGGGEVSPWQYTQGNTTVCDSASQCTYTFYLTDSYNDGWNNAYITILQNGIPVATIQPTGSFSTTSMTASLCDNLTTTLVWNEGMYDDECSFYVTDPFNITLYTSTPIPSGVLTTFTTSCTPPSCMAPSEISVSNIGNTSAEISWTSMGTETNWNVEYKTHDDTTWTVVPVTTNPYTLTGLTNLTLYDVRVQADCGNGDVSAYRTTSFQTNACEAANQCTYTFILTDSYGDGWNNGKLTIVQNNISIAVLEAENHYGEGPVSDTVSINLCDNISTSLVWTSGMYDGEASFALYASDGTLITSTTSMSSYAGYTFTTDCGITTSCAVPTGLTVSNITQTSGTATWTAGGSESSWIVEYKAASDANWQSATTAIASFTMNGLTPATDYQVRVRAVCDANEMSDWTETATFTTANGDTPTCPAPTNLTATLGNPSHTTVTLTWQQEANTANEWQINYRQTTEDNWSTATVTSTSYTLTDLVANVDYEANVVAHCTNGLTSDPSNTATWHTDNVGIQGYLDRSVTLYPNPATEMLNVAVSDANITITDMEVYNVYGQVVETFHGTSLQGRATINVSGLSDGVYFVRITTDSGVVTKNFVKK